MRTPIIRLTIGQTVALSGTAIDTDGEYAQINQRFQSEVTAREFIGELRDSSGYEFQLVTMRNCADYKRMAAIV
jgi:hypothetical protein